MNLIESIIPVRSIRYLPSQIQISSSF
jgi:hypothetical protein